MYEIKLETDPNGLPRKTKDGRFYMFSLETKTNEGKLVAVTKGFRLKTDLSLFFLPQTTYYNKPYPIVEMPPDIQAALLEWFKLNRSLLGI